MRTPYDSFAKQMLHSLLEPAGSVTSGEEVSPDPQKIDGWFVPDPARRDVLGRLGLLGRLALQSCIFEPYSNTPSLDGVCDCAAKLLNWRRVLKSRRQPEAVRTQQVRLWVLSPGQPRTAVRQLGLDRRKDWPQGVYLAAPGWGLGLVVLAELPPGRETLSLRLMGRGRTLRQASEELADLPASAWERQPLLSLLLRLHQQVSKNPRFRSRREEDFLVSTYESISRIEQELIERGRQEGRQEAIERLRSVLLVAYEVRFGPVPQPVRERVEAAQDPEALQRWTVLVLTAEPGEAARRILG